MSIATTVMDEMIVEGVSARVSNDDPASIGALWEHYRAAGLSAPAEDDIVCVYHDYEGDHTAPFRMTIGHRRSAETNDSSDLATVTVPKQQVTTCDASGPQPNALIAAWQGIWDSDLSRAFDADIEIHDAANPEHVTIYVGVQR